MLQRTIRFSETTRSQIDQAVEQGEFSSPTTFIRYAVGQQLTARVERRGKRPRPERRAAALPLRTPTPNQTKESQGMTMQATGVDYIWRRVGHVPTLRSGRNQNQLLTIAPDWLYSTSSDRRASLIKFCPADTVTVSARGIGVNGRLLPNTATAPLQFALK